MKLELDYDFLRDAGVPLDAEDLRLGVSLGIISPPVAIAVASGAVADGSGDPLMLELAEVDRGDIAGVRASLRAVDPEDAELFPPLSLRKWAYLQLKAVFELRDRLQDPLGVVEQIYADFDYPSAMAGFVRYMPPPFDAPIGEAALYDRWSSYLANEAVELTRDGA